MVRKQFSKKDCKRFLETHPEAESLMTKKSTVVQDDDKLYIEGVLSFIHLHDRWIPSLHILSSHPDILAHVIVDKGAIRFVVNGADIMRPGVVDARPFGKDAIIAVVDETVGKPIAVGKALLSSEDLLSASSGKVVQNIHHVDDEYWHAN